MSNRGEQYTGWKAIESGARAIGPATMSRDVALAVVRRLGGFDDQEGTDAFAAGYRRARAKAHPDVNGGSRNDWDQLELAARTLGLN